ncbi:uncharacterized protein LOC126354782 isoform X2 [Schistocerca gregaria]|uniref:uncharacterized protein LOC126354782 isoform X2 n=1 Tax=Schistocerca gregaria TaxID=7010 RepID=UPI00211E9F0D|nr:uncharacterized protein LOC126354782 isoform X2 [Schistocerca gregaria]
MEDFHYVVSKPKAAKVCFGSGCQRDVMGKPISRHGIQFTTEKFVNIGPASYEVKIDLLLHKPMSIYGVGPGARKAPRFNIKYPVVPSPQKYQLKSCIAPSTPAQAPFNSDVQRMKMQVNLNPGFGGKKRILPHVDVRCVYTKDECSFCHRHPCGDYWHFKYSEFMCQQCMQKVKKGIAHLIPLGKVDQFRRVRDCSFFHKHQGSEAAVRLMSANKIKQLEVKEAYLSQFFK